MLTIRHLNGSLAGTEVKVENKDRVVFGRQLDCDVQYPPEETAVARHHFAIARKPSGSWTVELFGTPFVAIDATPADNGQVVRDGARIELGRIGGPAFTLHISEDARTDNYLKTAGQAEAPSPRAVATQASTMARLARAVAGLAVVVALGGAGFAAYNMISASNTAARLDAAQKGFADALAREASLRIGPEVRAHLSRAVYHVQLQDAQQRIQAGGTAWVVGSNLLATNAHVAILRAPGENGAIYEVVEHKLHPGYVPFNAFLQSDQRLISQYRGGIKWLSGNGYDVATLRVTGTLPDNARLELATPDEIKALAAGAPLATSGYPTEGLLNTWAQGIGATPQQHLGVITAVTDMFHLPAAAAQRQLVHHDLPSTGGQSGSPIVGASGRVVALLNSGNSFMVNGRRIPNAAQVNYGQRVDLLRDLIDGSAEQKLAEAREHWKAVSENFAPGKDVFPANILDQSRPADGARPRLFAEVTRKLNAKAGKRLAEKNDDFYVNYSEIPLKLSPGADYTFLALAEGGSTRLDVYVDGKLATKAVADHYPFVSCRLLSASQQNTGNPERPRAGCAAEAERADGMRIPEGNANARDVGLVVYNIKDATDALASADLTYLLRIYQWVPERR